MCDHKQLPIEKNIECKRCNSQQRYLKYAKRSFLSLFCFWGFFSKKAYLYLYLYTCECRFLESYIQYQKNKNLFNLVKYCSILFK